MDMFSSDVGRKDWIPCRCGSITNGRRSAYRHVQEAVPVMAWATRNPRRITLSQIGSQDSSRAINEACATTWMLTANSMVLTAIVAAL
jgi:hypothetical protein